MSTPTTSADDALSRAKAIAARLSGSSAKPASPSLTKESIPTKRKRWGVAPSAVNQASQEALPGLADAAKKFKEAAEPSRKRIWVNVTAERPESHFYSYLVRGYRLEDIARKVNQEAGVDDSIDASSKILVELKGRGSSNKAALPGIPEEPMLILLTGPDELVTKASPLIDAVLDEAEKAAVEVTVDNVDNREDNSTALALTRESSGYRPATVAQLISNNPAMGHTGKLIEESIDVPNGIVGYLIGRGGETISSMQARSGCRVQIQKEHELKPGATMRVITLQATTQESIDECRGMIESMVQDRIRAAGGGGSAMGSKDSKVNEALAAGHHLVEVDVPDADVGLIIGKGGTTIKMIQESTGASIQIPPTGNPDNPSTRTVQVTHPNEAGAKQAKKQIEDLLNSKPSYAQTQGQQTTMQVLIPDKDVGLCIGRQGCVIKEMQQKTGTRIQIPSQPTPGQPHRVATVTGTQDGCNKAQALIERIINEQSSACVMSGTSFNNSRGHYLNQQYYGGQQQGNESSAEWQAFYAAQGLVNQAQPQASASAPAHAAPQHASPAPGPAADAYYEQFFRYSYYYGEKAAREYYGAWAPPQGTTNPYGINPQGVTPAPSSQQSQPSQTPAPTQQREVARDSSVRKVSNLPAWMTRN